MMLARAGKFFLIGVLVTAIHLLISYSLVVLGYMLLWANCMAFAIAFFISYFLQSSFTYGKAYSWSRLARFAIVALIALLGSQTVAYFCLKLEIPLEYGVLFSGLTPPGISFVLNHVFVFADTQTKR